MLVEWIKFDLSADYIEWETLTYSKKAFSIALPLSICLRIIQHGDCICLTVEEGVKTYYIFQHRLSCLSVAF